MTGENPDERSAVPEKKWWVWQQHGDAEYIWGTDLDAAIDRYAENRKVPFGARIYATNADNVARCKVLVGRDDA